MSDMPSDGIPIEDPKKLEQKELLERLKKAMSDMESQRRESERRFHDLEGKCKADLDRLRASTAEHARALKSENEALVKSLARLQWDADALKEENAVLNGRLQELLKVQGKGV